MLNESFYTTDDDTVDGATAADEGEATEAPGGTYRTVRFCSTTKHTDAKFVYWALCQKVPLVVCP